MLCAMRISSLKIATCFLTLQVFFSPTVFPKAVIMDGCGLNPLFVAIRFNADVSVVRCLVQAYPKCTLTRDRGGGLPLRRAIENQSPIEIQACLCTSPEVVLDADTYIHNTALHGALECGTAREATVELLVRTAPEIALTRAKCGQTPLDFACQRWLRFHSPRRGEAHVWSLWRMVLCLMRAAFYGPSLENNVDSPILHAAVSLQVPPKVVLHVLHTRRDETRLLDSEGRYPLQLAIQSHPPLDYAMTLVSLERFLEQKEKVILELLEIYPEAASLPNSDGRVALSLAAGESSVSNCVLQALWRVNPTLLRQLDPVTGLYPFQIAALPTAPLPRITSQRSAEQWRQKADGLRLTAVFDLIKQAPDLIRLQHAD